MQSIFKPVALMAVMIMTTQVSAHTFRAIKSSKDKDLSSAMKVGQAFVAATAKANPGSSSGNTLYRAYSVTEISPPQGKKESDSDLYIRLAKAVLHRDFPITGDDGGYTIGQIEKKGDLRKDLGDIFTQDGDNMKDAVNELQSQLAKAIDAGLLVYSGTGSGNNTMAFMLIVANPDTAEMFYIIDSNFGSDN